MERTWTLVDDDVDAPDARALQRSRSALRFDRSEPDPAVADLAAVFAEIMPGGRVFGGTFTAHGADEVCEWYLSRNRFGEYGLVEAVLTSDALAAAAPGITDGVRFEPDTFVEHTAVELDGAIASALVWGGAHHSYRGRAAEAKRIGVAFSDGVVGDRYDEFRFDSSVEDWSDWFHDIAWDMTWVVTDLRAKRFTVLAVSDTD